MFDAWEQRKLGEEIQFYSGLTYHPNDVISQGVLVIRSSNIKNNMIVGADNVYVPEDSSTSLRVNIGDIIVVVRNGSRALIGKHAVVKKQMNAVIGAFMTGIRTNQSEFINAMLDSNQFSAEIQKDLGATINQITTGNFKKMKFYLPMNETEKTKIGQLFRYINDIIALHERKLELLKRLKEAYLQQLFPKNKSTTPRLRFTGFTDVWEKHKLGELYKKVIEKNDLTIPRDQVISVAKMRWGSIPSRSSDNYMRSYNVMRIGDIAFEGHKSKNFSFGRFVENTLGVGLVSHVFDVFRPRESMNTDYWKYFIHNEYNMRNVLRMSTTNATMMMNLVAKDFLKQSVLVPQNDEQVKISELLLTIDNITKLHERKSQELKYLKLAFLQKLFV